MTQTATSVLLALKAPNLMIRKKSVFKVCFINFFQQTSKVTLIPLNGLGPGCKVGSECTTDQVCDASTKKCIDCKKGVTKPDEDKAKCIKIPSMLYYSFLTTIKYTFNTCEWPRSRLQSRLRMPHRQGLWHKQEVCFL